MGVISQTASAPPSALNPSAPMFVPTAFRSVEDFSGEWWDLVRSSPWFQDYWLKERFLDPQTAPVFSPNDDRVLPDTDSPFDTKQEEGERVNNKDLITLGALKWRNVRKLSETLKFAEKAPKIVNRKVIPRPIQQPR